MLALEYAFSIDIDDPLAPRLAILWSFGGSRIVQLWSWLRLVEIPPQRSPQHHCYLSGRAARRLEFVRVWIGDHRNE